LALAGLAWDGLWKWLWANFKSLIPDSFLALAVALAFIDSKGLFGFGDGVRHG
jgi:hypothetical protein